MTRLVVIAIALVAVVGAAAAPPPDAQVTFVNQLGLLSVGANGAGLTLMRDASCPSTDLPPCYGAEASSWSPDGTKLAAVIASRLFLFDGSGGPPTQLQTGVPVSGKSPPVWSPDGRRIAFLAFQQVDGFGALYDIGVVNLANGGVTLLTHGQEATDPAWAPGPQIVYANVGADNRFDLFVVDPDSGASRQLTHAQAGEVNRRPAWSPDGTRIAFIHFTQLGDDAGHGRLEVMPVAGGDATVLSDDRVDAVNDQAPAWSPDGTEIAYSTSVNGRPSPITQIVTGRDLYVARADGSGERRLTQSAERNVADANPTWSSDGRELAFETSDRDGYAVLSIYAVNRDGTCEHRLADPGWRPAWQPDVATPSYECADLSVIARSPRTQGPTGSMIVTVLNEGTEPLTGVVLDSRSVAGNVLSARTPLGSCSVKAGSLSCAIGSLAPRQSIDVTARVDSRLVTQAVGIVLGGVVTFTGHAAEHEQSLENNSVSLEVETTRCTTNTAGGGRIVGTIFDDRVCGTRGNDVIVPGAGRDTVYAGAGNDVIDVRDGERDTVFCGAGKDTVYADSKDVVASDCERVVRR